MISAMGVIALGVSGYEKVSGLEDLASTTQNQIIAGHRAKIAGLNPLNVGSSVTIAGSRQPWRCAVPGDA